MDLLMPPAPCWGEATLVCDLATPTGHFIMKAARNPDVDMIGQRMDEEGCGPVYAAACVAAGVWHDDWRWNEAHG